jgi:hypothetical protein
MRASSSMVPRWRAVGFCREYKISASRTDTWST